jgi:mono/diheme cytochrome c family protein
MKRTCHCERSVAILAVIFGIVVLVVAASALYLMFTGPRMRIQPKLMPNRARIPTLPDGIVPISGVETQDFASLPVYNPLPRTERTRRTGQVYYGYYCVFCHGRTGRGDGPVGQSYTPVPTDLTSPPVRNLSDGDLYRAMLTGVGHEPVLPHVIVPQAPWYIVSYIRHLQSQDGGNTQERSLSDEQDSQ